ncbi:MAG: CBS domain-containing protein [Candidatus Micrarchaeia archaeon]
MDRKVVALSPDSTILVSARLIETSSVELLPVVEGGKLIGIIEGSAILNYTLKHGREELGAPIRPFMKPPLFVEKDEPVNSVVAKIISNNLTRIPVVDSKKSMKCIGIISASDLLKEIG